MKKRMIITLIFLLPIASFAREEEVFSQKERGEKINQALDFIEGKFYLSLGWNPYYLSYEEVEGGEVSDEDYGKMDDESYYIKFGYRFSRFLGNLWGSPFIEAYFKRANDRVTYDGATWGGTPVKFKEKSKIYRFGVKLGGRKQWQENINIYSYMDIGKREWHRGENEIVSGAQNYKEKYWWVYLGWGAGIEYLGIEKTSLGVDIAFFTAPKALRKMYAHLGKGVTFDLGTIWGVELVFPIRYRIGKNWSFDITPYYTCWCVDKSNVKVIELEGNLVFVYEPKNETDIYGVLVGFTLSI